MARAEFSTKVRTAVALRAGYRCSFTGCSHPTVGPSDEAADAVTMVGEAAHIHAASSGPGARRYLASMPAEERTDIGNAIWLCARHARLIDRDEATYTADALRAMKRTHEANCTAEVREPVAAERLAGELIALGPDVVCVGEILGSSEDEWSLSLHHFVEGDVHSLMSYIEAFRQTDNYDRYVCVGSLGDGRVLRAAPSWTRQGNGYVVQCPVFGTSQRQLTSELGVDLAFSDSRDLCIENGDIATVSGVKALRQKIKLILCQQRGESAFYEKSGTRLAEYYSLFGNSVWLEQLLKLEVIRLSAIPYPDPVLRHLYTPFQCVERVFHVEVSSEGATDGWLPVKLDLAIKGLGRWQCDVSVWVRVPERRLSFDDILAGPRPSFR